LVWTLLIMSDFLRRGRRDVKKRGGVMCVKWGPKRMFCKRRRATVSKLPRSTQPRDANSIRSTNRSPWGPRRTPGSHRIHLFHFSRIGCSTLWSGTAAHVSEGGEQLEVDPVTPLDSGGWGLSGPAGAVCLGRVPESFVFFCIVRSRFATSRASSPQPTQCEHRISHGTRCSPFRGRRPSDAGLADRRPPG